MEVVRAAAARQAQGADVLHLEVGQPATGAPAGAIAGAHRAIDNNVLGYTNALGIDPLRQRIAEHYQHTYSVEVSPDVVAITMGATGACVLAFLACFDPGDRVAVMSPGYPCYRNMLTAFGIEVVDVQLSAETRFQPTPEVLADAGPLDGVVVASPSNPTGTMLSPTELTALVRYCHDNNIRLISDEIYHGISYGQPGTTAWSDAGSAIVINSFSKYFSMTGWRLGWMLVPSELLTTVERLAQNLVICAPTVSQFGGLGAFDSLDELDGHLAVYRTNRDILLEGLPQAGLDRLAPADGAFYVYANVDHLTSNSQELCAQWLDQLNLAATPGVDFDPTNGHRYVRFSFAGSPETMHEAVRRLTGH